jgi:hypothetical protein
MTTIPTAIRFARLGLAASLLGAGLLIGSVQASAAGEIAPAPVSATPSQAQGAGPSTQGTPAKSSSPDLCPTGVAGFGWG